MKKIVLFLCATFLCGVASLAWADTYQINVSWVDPTVYDTGEEPTYNLEWKCTPVASGSPCTGTATAVSGLATPSYSTTVTALPEDVIEARVQNENAGLVSAWSIWYTATAPSGPTQPIDPTSVIITITRQ